MMEVKVFDLIQVLALLINGLGILTTGSKKEKKAHPTMLDFELCILQTHL